LPFHGLARFKALAHRFSTSETPLFWAGNAAVAEILISHGADPNERNGLNRTPLHAAARNWLTEVVVCLIINGANVNAEDDNGNAPLNVSWEKGDKKAIIVLVNYGAWVKSKKRL
jgi:ankyrin repeat protein